MAKLSASTLRLLYQEQGHTIKSIARDYGLSEEYVSNRLIRLKILNFDNSILKIQKISDRYLKHYAEFNNKVKKKAFSISQGRCEICTYMIGDGSNYKLAEYHHIVMVNRGGLGNLDNCMVLHPDCHIRYFKKLHGFDFDPSKLYRK